MTLIRIIWNTTLLYPFFLLGPFLILTLPGFDEMARTNISLTYIKHLCWWSLYLAPVIWLGCVIFIVVMNVVSSTTETPKPDQIKD